MLSGFFPAPMAATIAGSRPALSANGSCAYHSYCEPQACAVMRIAISLTRLSSEVLNLTYSPTFCRRSASSGLRSHALKGPLNAFLGPHMMASATLRWAAEILSRGISAMRSPVNAKAEPANSIQTAEMRRMVFMEPPLKVRPIKRRAVDANCCTPAGFRQSQILGLFRPAAYHANVTESEFCDRDKNRNHDQSRRDRPGPRHSSFRRVSRRTRPEGFLSDRKPKPRKAGRTARLPHGRSSAGILTTRFFDKTDRIPERKASLSARRIPRERIGAYRSDVRTWRRRRRHGRGLAR